MLRYAAVWRRLLCPPMCRIARSSALAVMCSSVVLVDPQSMRVVLWHGQGARALGCWKLDGCTTPSRRSCAERRRRAALRGCAAWTLLPAASVPPIAPVRAVVMDLLLWLIFERACRERGCTTSMSLSRASPPTRRPVSVRFAPDWRRLCLTRVPGCLIPVQACTIVRMTPARSQCLGFAQRKAKQHAQHLLST
jgi:hypothetical protein